MAVEDDLQTLDEIGRAAQEYGSSVSPYAGLQDYLLQRPVFARGDRESIQIPTLRTLDAPDYTQQDERRRVEELLANQRAQQTSSFETALSDLKKTLQEENLASAKAEAGQRSALTQQLEDQLATIKAEVDERQKALEAQGITERQSLRDERQKLLDDLQANIDTAKQELAESQAKVKETQDKSLGDLKDTQSSLIADLKERMSSLGGDLTAIKEDIRAELDKRDENLTGTQKEAADAIQSEIDALREDFVSLGDTVETETGEQTELLRGERDALITGLENKIADLSENITGLPIEDIQARIDALKTDNETIKETASERNSAIGEQIEDLKEQLGTATGTQQQNLESAIDALRQELGGTAQDIGTQREADLAALRAEIEDRINREQDVSEDIRGQYQTQIMSDTRKLLDDLAQQVQQDRGQAIQSALDPLAAQREEAIQRSLAPIAEQRSADIQAALNPAVAGIQEQIDALRGQMPQQQAPVDVDALRQQITDEIMAQMSGQTTPGSAPRGGGEFTPTPGTGTVPDFVSTPTTIPDTTPQTKGPVDLGGRKTQPTPQFEPTPTTIPDPVVDSSMLGPVVNPEIRIDQGMFGNRMTPTPAVIPPPPPIMPTRPTRNLRTRGFGR